MCFSISAVRDHRRLQHWPHPASSQNHPRSAGGSDIPSHRLCSHLPCAFARPATRSSCGGHRRAERIRAYVFIITAAASSADGDLIPRRKHKACSATPEQPGSPPLAVSVRTPLPLRSGSKPGQHPHRTPPVTCPDRVANESRGMWLLPRQRTPVAGLHTPRATRDARSTASAQRGM